MKCSLPHMGNYYLAFKSFFKTVEIDYSPAPPITKRTIELGAKYSPEFVCLPFKINLGNLIEALEEGVDLLFQSGSRGACRYGSYLDLQKRILEDIGFKDFRMIRLFDTTDIGESWSQLKSLNPKISFFELLKALRLTFAKINTIDKAEDLIRHTKPYVSKSSEVESLHQNFLQDIDRTDNFRELKRKTEKFKRSLKEARNLNIQPLKIGIVGELYVVMEPNSNLNLERQLGDMGVEVFRPLTLSHMLKDFLFLGLPRRYYLRLARPYLKFDGCAHSNISVAEAMLFAKHKLDGVIHIKPHACMPEVTAMSALCNVSKDYNIPVLFLSFDEHTSSVGLKTRLEAFVELLKRKKKCT